MKVEQIGASSLRRKVTVLLIGCFLIAGLDLSAAPDLTLTLADSPDPVTAGELLHYDLAITNHGTSLASGVTLTNTLPAGVVFFSASVSQGTFSQNGGLVVCSFGNINAGGSATARITVTPGVVGTITNSVLVSLTQVDANPADNSASSATTVVPMTFYAGPNLKVGRAYHTATTLADGRILIAGGVTSTGLTTTAELYDPQAKTFSLTGNMNKSRGEHTATLLMDGTVLMAGGSGDGGLGHSAEIYDPTTGQFTSVSNMIFGHVAGSAARLADGRVLVVGDYFNTPADADLYLPAQGGFTNAGRITSGTVWGRSILLDNGNVFVAGGRGVWGGGATCDLYDPVAATFTPVAPLAQMRLTFGIAKLTDGRVLMVGGTGWRNAEIYDPVANVILVTNSTRAIHYAAEANLLADGTVLVTGWNKEPELFHPATGSFSRTVEMIEAHQRHTASLLPDGSVLIVGGLTNGVYSPSTEIYDPARTKSPPQVSIAGVSLAEGNIGNTNAVFNLTLSTRMGVPVAVSFVTSPIDTTPDTDYVTTSGTVVFPPGETNQTITVAVIGNVNYDPDKSFSVNLSNPTNALLDVATATGSILNDDPRPTITATSAAVLEPNVGATNFILSVMLSASSYEPIFVNYATGDGGAVSGVDYIATNGLLTFDPRVTNLTIALPVLGDTLFETNEEFYVTLTSPTNASVGPPAVVTIVSDDGLPGVLHHFSFDPIPPPQYETLPIPLTITARDAFENLAPSFNGRVVLTGNSTNQPSHVFGFEEGNFSQWAPLNAGSSPGPYVFSPFDVNGDGAVSTAFSLSPNSGSPDGITRTVPLLGGTPYTISMDIAQSNEGGGLNGGDTLVHLLVGGVELKVFSFSVFGNIGNGEVDRTNIVATFTPPATGDYVLTILIDRGWQEYSPLRGYVDEVRVASPGLSPATVGNFVNGVWSGSIVASGAVSNYVLHVDDLDGHFGGSAPFDILNYADLRVQTVVSPNPARVGSNLTYTVTVSNLGSGTATGIVLTNPLPPELTFLSATSANGNCVFTNGAVVCNLGKLSSQQSALINIVTRPTLPMTVTNENGVTSLAFDPDLANNGSINVFDVNPPLLYIKGPSVVERTGASTNAQFQVFVGGPFQQTIEVDYATANGSALAGLDYLATSGHLTFTPGVTSQIVKVTVLDDLSNEPNETFSMNLSGAVNAQLAFPGTTNCTILDNFDPLPGVSISDGSVIEGSSGTNTLIFNVGLNPPSGRTVTINYTFGAGTATMGVDYLTNNFFTPPYTLTFPANSTNQIIAIPILTDTVNEPDESFFINLSYSFSGTPAGIIVRAQGVGTILNDDNVAGQLDHFEWSTIPSPSRTGQNIAVALRARDASNNTYTGLITNTVNLTARAGTGNVVVAISPTTAGPFINGVWSGNLSISSANSNVVLRADDGRGRFGLSNPFNVVTPTTLLLTMPTSATESDGVLAGQGRVSLPANTGSPHSVNLSSSDSTELTVPPNVMIPAGQSNAFFDLALVDDGILDGSQTVTITATASGYVSASAAMPVHDNELATITLGSLPPSLSESASPFNAAITLSAPAGSTLTVPLMSSDTTEVQVPTTVTFNAGQSSKNFAVTVINDSQLDGPQPVTITAHVENWTDGVVNTTVLDNETNRLSFRLSPNSPIYAEGQGFATNITLQLSSTLATNLVVALDSSDTTELTVPTSVTIAAGATSAPVILAIVNDTEFDGTQIAALTASAAGFVSVSTNLTITDNDAHHFNFSTITSPQQGTVAFNVTIRARDVNDVNMSGYSAYLALRATSDGGPVTITPSAVTMTGGLWSGNIAVTGWEYQNVRLTVTDPDDNSSQSSPFDVVPPAAFLTSVNAHDLVYSETTRLIYAGYTNAGTLQPLEPFYAVPGTPVPVGPLSGKLTISDGGQYVFAALNTPSNRICQFEVNSQSVVAAWNLDGLFVEDMCPVPGSPAAVAVSRKVSGGSPRFRGVAIYDNGVARSNVANAFLGPNVIELSGTPGKLFGYNNESSPASTHTLNYDASGITLGPGWSGLQGFNVDIACRGGLIFATTGQIFDPSRSLQISSFTGGLPVAEDPASGRIYVISAGAVTAYDLPTLLPVGATATGLNPQGTSCVRWGTNGLAFRASSRVALVRTPLIASGLPADVVLSVANADGPAAAGNNFTYSLNVSNSGSNPARGIVIASTLSANAQFISATTNHGPVTQVSGGFVCAVSNLAVGATATVNVTLKPLKPGLLASRVSVTSDSLDPNLANNSTLINTAVGALLPADSVVEFALTTSDIIYEPQSGRLFMSVPNADRWLGNKLLALNPAAGQFDAPIALAVEPAKLAVSDNGQYLYAAINSDNSIQRVNLTTRAADLKFPTGYAYAADIAVLPGNPQSVIATVHTTFAVYDNGVRRTNVVGPGAYNFEYNLAVSGTNTLAYETMPYAFRRIGIDEGGASLLQEIGDTLINSFDRQIKYDSGLLFTGGGRVFNPETSALVANVPFGGLVAPDVQSRRVFYLGVNGSVGTLHSVETTNFTEVGSITIPGISGTATSLVRWGVDGLAFRTSGGQMFLIRTTLANDLDNDALADWWEQQHFGSTNAQNGGLNDDPDGDGMSNFAEFQAGTDPLDELSRFVFTAIQTDSLPGAVLRWSSASNQSYSLLRSGDPLSSFSLILSNIAATPPENTLRDSNAVGPGPWYYRLRLR